MEKITKAGGLIKRIALIGPESSGKSTLCIQLARHFRTSLVSEYAREYISKLTLPYTLSDIEKISKTQLALEEEALKKANRFLFVDTELINARVWSLDVFNTCPAWIENKISEHPYDLYLLTSPDIPWLADPVRENGHRREFFFQWYKRELDKRGFSYTVISGSGEQRIISSIRSVSTLAE